MRYKFRDFSQDDLSDEKKKDILNDRFQILYDMPTPYWIYVAPNKQAMVGGSLQWITSVKKTSPTRFECMPDLYARTVDGGWYFNFHGSASGAVTAWVKPAGWYSGPLQNMVLSNFFPKEMYPEMRNMIERIFTQ